MASAEGSGSLQVIGAGLSRTGTQSLKLALELLGFRTLHGGQAVWANKTLRQAWADWLHRGADFEPALHTIVGGGFTAVVDQPACHAYQELTRRFPQAKIILTVRETAERWLEGICRVGASWREFDACRRKQECRLAIHLNTDVDLPQLEDILEFDLAQKSLHGCDLLRDIRVEPESREKCINGYLRHNAEVKQTVPPGQLLVLNVKEGWAPLCAFLGMPVPEAPFPWGDGVAEDAMALPNSNQNHQLRTSVGFFLCLLLLAGGRCCWRRIRRRPAAASLGKDL